MKRFYSKILACMLITLMMVSAISICTPVKASTSSTLAYYEMIIPFQDGCTVARGFDGIFLKVRLMATASNGNSEKVTLEVRVNATNKIHTYTFYTDGLTYEFKNIYLGLSGGSDVGFGFKAENPNVTITVNMIAES